MQTTASSQQNIDPRSFQLRIGFIALGYLLVLIASLLLFIIPLYASALLVVAGIVMDTVAARPLPLPAPTWRYYLIAFAGMMVLTIVVICIGREGMSQWRPTAIGYLLAWGASVQAIRKLYLLLPRRFARCQ